MAERGELTRQKLVEVALRLFREDGYQATTMRRIAAEAGVSLGNAYYYFASKDELVHDSTARCSASTGAGCCRCCGPARRCRRTCGSPCTPVWM